MKYVYGLLSFFLLTACSAPVSTEPQLLVHAFKVGKADSFLVSYKDEHILIDAGEEDDGEKIVAYLKEQQITKLKALMITHFDKDHVGGADHVVNAVEIENIYVPNYESDSKQTKQFLKAVDARDYVLSKITTDTAFSIQDVNGMMYPPATLYAGDNNNSLVISLAYKETNFLFAGDIEAERIKDMLMQQINMYTFLKVPHHGRFNEQTAAFIHTVQPQIALITSSDKHPEAAATVGVLEEADAQIYTTRMGDVTFMSDGSQMTTKK